MSDFTENRIIKKIMHSVFLINMGNFKKEQLYLHISLFKVGINHTNRCKAHWEDANIFLSGKYK